MALIKNMILEISISSSSSLSSLSSGILRCLFYNVKSDDKMMVHELACFSLDFDFQALLFVTLDLPAYQHYSRGDW